MYKTISLIRGRQDESYDGFRTRIFAVCEQINSANSAARLCVTLTEESPPRFSIIPFSKKKIAAVSFFDESDAVKKLEGAEGFAGTFHVTEALPVSYQKTWTDGDVTPGVCLLTLFRQKPSIDYPTFIHRWHNSHTPLSLKIHPLWHYNRNVINESDPGDDITHYDGIVEEHFRDPSDLLNPFKFFGNPLIIIGRMLQVYIDVKSFIDYGSIESYMVREYWISDD